MSEDRSSVKISLLCAGGWQEVYALRYFLGLRGIQPHQYERRSDAIMYWTTRPDVVESMAVTVAGLVGVGAVKIEHEGEFNEPDMPPQLHLQRE